MHLDDTQVYFTYKFTHEQVLYNLFESVFELYIGNFKIEIFLFKYLANVFIMFKIHTNFG